MWGMRWRRRAPEVRVVTRAGCHLCVEMERVVGEVLGRPVGTLDLDAELASGGVHPEQHARWTTLVPVLLVDGREVAHHRVDPGLVRKALGRR